MLKKKNKDTSCACCASRFECPLSKARGYNMLDVEVMRGSWKSREGQQVRRYVGKFAKEEASLLEDATRLLRACAGMVIFADMAGRRVAKYRNVFSWQQGSREEACARLLQVLKCIESNSLDKPVCLKQMCLCSHSRFGRRRTRLQSI